MQSFIISFFTSLVVAAGVSSVFYYGTQASAPEVEEDPMVELPNLTGMSQEAARAHLTGVGLVWGKVNEVDSETAPKGQVLGTVPVRFTELRRGTVIEVNISAGISTVKVPDVKRTGMGKAKRALKDAGFEIDVKFAFDEDLGENRVIRQEPEGGADAAPGSTVMILVNSDEYEDY